MQNARLTEPEQARARHHFTLRREHAQKTRLIAQPRVMEIHQLLERMHGCGVKFSKVLAQQAVKDR